MERVRGWPGVQSGRALLDGEPMIGHWFERAREYAARNRRQSIERLRFASEETVILSPIPCWAHLPPEVYLARVAALVESIEAAAALQRSQSGVEKRRDRGGSPASLAGAARPRSDQGGQPGGLRL